MADLGGMNHQDRKLMHDTTADIHRSDRRSASPDAALGSTHHTDGRGGEQSATEGAAEEDDDEDDETDADVPALPYGYGKGGKGKGKRPSIRVEPVEDESHGEEDETSHGTENVLTSSKHPVNQLLMSSKKRTFSNLSSTSVLFGDDSTDQESFPRRKMARKLSNAASMPLLTYQENDDAQVTYENAIESDDEDYSGVNLVPDDDDDMDMMERMEESFILQEEQQATTLLNEYRDARRLSLESCLSDNIFDVTAPLDDTYMSSLPDYGFSQFFEPEALPASPVPIAKRKFSDGSAKRVRFDDDVQVSDSSSSESSELDSSVFPDLFLDQDKIPPSLHQLLDMDNDDDNGDMASQTSEGSFWDFEQNESRITQVAHSDDDNESSGESSGYECMVMPYICLYTSTNVPSQLTWVIPLMKKTLGSTSCHEPLSKEILSCDDRPQHQAQELPHLSLSSAVHARLAARFHPLVAFSYTAKLTKLLPSLTERLRRSSSTVHAQRWFHGFP
jgi:hypothetical protein